MDDLKFVYSEGFLDLVYVLWLDERGRENEIEDRLKGEKSWVCK